MNKNNTIKAIEMCIRDRLYTVLTNKEARGGKGSMIAIIKGTDVHTVTSVLLKLSRCV